MLRPDQLPNIPFFSNCQRLRQVGADLSGRLGVIAEACGGTTSTVEPVIACMKYLEACLLTIVPAAPQYPTVLGNTAASVVAAAEYQPHLAPSILFAPVGSAFRSDLVRAVQQARYDACVRADGKSANATALTGFMDTLAADIAVYKPAVAAAAFAAVDDAAAPAKRTRRAKAPVEEVKADDAE